MAKIRKKVGLPPGSVIFTGSRKVEEVQIHFLKYNNDYVEDNRLNNHKEIVFHESEDHIIDWYDLRGLHDAQLIEQIGAAFKLHSLVLEDIADIQQRPKFEEYKEGIFLVFRALSFDKTTKKINSEQVALYFKKGLVLSFQEDHTDIFVTVRQRIHAGKGKIRLRGADYLAYALADNIVDNYFLVLDEVEEEIEHLEDNLLTAPKSSSKGDIHHLKKEVIRIRKSIAPLREAISRFSKSDSELIEDSTSVFVRDLYDHTIQIMDIVDSYRDMLNGLQDLYLSEISFKMNQVMQVLTIITTIFVPLSFLAGLYGMNFENMPELHYRYGYFVLIGVMFLIGSGLLFWFRKKRWL